MRRNLALALTLTVALAIPALADTVQLTLTGVSDNSGGVYTYPYDFTVVNSKNVTTTNVPLMCDTFLNDVSVNESWTAYVNPITSVGTGTGTSGGLFAGKSFTNSLNSSGYQTYGSQAAYDAAGLIYLGALGKGPLASYLSGSTAITNLSAGLANWAIWDLFDPQGTGSSSGNQFADPYGTLPFTLGALSALDSAALSDAGNNANVSLLADVVIYTPQAGSQNPQCDGTPQEYIGMVPEPASLLLMGAGLLAGARTLGRKLRA